MLFVSVTWQTDQGNNILHLRHVGFNVNYKWIQNLEANFSFSFLNLSFGGI